MDVDETQEYGQGQDLKTAFERTATVADTSPVKEKLAKMRRMLSEKDDVPATGQSSTGSSSNDILDAIGLLSKKMDHMAIEQKAEMEQLKSHISSETKLQIAEAVDPLKSEMHDKYQAAHHILRGYSCRSVF